ncbi:WD40 repeat domain-containing protein [Virgisporangium aurantiacum]|uniref:WD40-like Beta Propeller Repeat n=1 Tax=Virgisporangium aurantiacum TaxID=175570 RepID=A0A8J3ZAY5_9ACTN|nr:WD40 repeat domain-containing protein [Virgisporangium aurantiacum]GIJ57968.1 hypothetical protein Vau01_054840 [Virgisporangium aurantiacum]
MNETIVRTALHQAAEGIEPFPVLDAAMRQARRRRFGRLVAVPAAVALLAAVAVAGWTGVSRERAERPAGPTQPLPGLPVRLHDPRTGVPTVHDQPPGAMAVAYTGTNFGALAESLYVVLSGPAGYRVTDRWPSDEVHVGEEVLLSPAGDRLASHESADGTTAVLDLRTGRQRLLRRPWGGDMEPLAWAPDNRTMAVVVSPKNRGGWSDIWNELGLFDTETGTYRRIGRPGGKYSPGFAVAFSRDGQRLAYQSDDRIDVVDLNGSAVADFLVSPNSRLAGKGAFTPDGAAIAVSVTEGCCTHRFAFHDIATGVEQPERRSVAVPDTGALRLLGWSPRGEAVAVAFRHDPGAEPASDAGRTWFEVVRRVEVVTVGSGAVIINASSNVQAVDLADQAIATGQMVTAPPKPTGFDPPFPLAFEDLPVVAILLLPVSVPVVAVISLVWLVRWRRRARRRA